MESKKKLSVLYVLEVLKKFTDENHILTQQEIIDKTLKCFNLKLDRKTISSNIDDLIDFGFDIIKTSKGTFLCSREFEEGEIRFLIDAVFSSKVISSKYAQDLAKKISSFLSCYKQTDYNYILKSSDVSRSNNKQLFYNIEIIGKAINENKKIEFTYFKNAYLNNNNTKKFKVSPYFLVNNHSSYYLVCNYEKYENLANYRLEYIKDIKIINENAKDINSLNSSQEKFDIAKYVNENIYMHSGDSVLVKLKLENESAINDCIDWFGDNIKINKVNDEIFAEVVVNENAIVYWALQYGSKVEVIEPLSVREKIVKELSKINIKYL